MRTYRSWDVHEVILVQSQVKSIIEKESNYYRSTKYLMEKLDRTYSSILAKLQNEYYHLMSDSMLYLITPQGVAHFTKEERDVRKANSRVSKVSK